MMYAQFITKGCLEVDRLVHLFYGNHVWARIKFPLLMLSAFVWYSSYGNTGCGVFKRGVQN